MADLRTSMPFPTPPRRAIDTASPPGSAPVAPVAPVIPAASIAPASRRQESTLTVGQNISLTGQISACDVLIVEGHVEASISCRLIEIAPGGVFNGKAEVDTAEVNGRIEGESRLAAPAAKFNGKAEVDTAEVNGGLKANSSSSTAYPLLRVHAGGQVDGWLTFATAPSRSRRAEGWRATWPRAAPTLRQPPWCQCRSTATHPIRNSGRAPQNGARPSTRAISKQLEPHWLHLFG